MTSRDMLFVRHNKLWRSDAKSVFRSPIDNLMRLIGHYLGSRSNRLPQAMVQRLSYDKKLLLGLRSGSSDQGN